MPGRLKEDSRSPSHQIGAEKIGDEVRNAVASVPRGGQEALDVQVLSPVLLEKLHTLDIGLDNILSRLPSLQKFSAVAQKLAPELQEAVQGINEIAQEDLKIGKAEASGIAKLLEKLDSIYRWTCLSSSSFGYAQRALTSSIRDAASVDADSVAEVMLDMLLKLEKLEREGWSGKQYIDLGERAGIHWSIGSVETQGTGKDAIWVNDYARLMACFFIEGSDETRDKILAAALRKKDADEPGCKMITPSQIAQEIGMAWSNIPDEAREAALCFNHTKDLWKSLSPQRVNELIAYCFSRLDGESGDILFKVLSANPGVIADYFRNHPENLSLLKDLPRPKLKSLFGPPNYSDIRLRILGSEPLKERQVTLPKNMEDGFALSVAGIEMRFPPEKYREPKEKDLLAMACVLKQVEMKEADRTRLLRAILPKVQGQEGKIVVTGEYGYEYIFDWEKATFATKTGALEEWDYITALLYCEAIRASDLPQEYKDRFEQSSFRLLDTGEKIAAYTGNNIAGRESLERALRRGKKIVSTPAKDLVLIQSSDVDGVVELRDPYHWNPSPAEKIWKRGMGYELLASEAIRKGFLKPSDFGRALRHVSDVKGVAIDCHEGETTYDHRPDFLLGNASREAALSYNIQTGEIQQIGSVKGVVVKPEKSLPPEESRGAASNLLALLFDLERYKGVSAGEPADLRSLVLNSMRIEVNSRDDHQIS